MRIYYFVEGQCEKALVNELKNKPQLIHSGSIQIVNVVENLISKSMLAKLDGQSHVVFIFDTDTKNEDILQKNISAVKKYVPRVKLSLIPQIENLEDELVYSCNIKRIEDFLSKAKTVKDFKHEFTRVSNLRSTLEKNKFDITKIWTRIPKYKSISRVMIRCISKLFSDMGE